LITKVCQVLYLPSFEIMVPPLAPF